MKAINLKSVAKAKANESAKAAKLAAKELNQARTNALRTYRAYYKESSIWRAIDSIQDEHTLLNLCGLTADHITIGNLKSIMPTYFTIYLKGENGEHVPAPRRTFNPLYMAGKIVAWAKRGGTVDGLLAK